MSEHDKKIRDMAIVYLSRHDDVENAKKEAEAARRRLEVAQSQLNMVRDELAGTVGRNIPVRNIVIDRQLVRVEFDATFPVRVEQIL